MREEAKKMSQTHIKWIRQALDKARPKEIRISWDGYYPMCPRCGSWEAERHRGEIWPYCPMCGQKLKDLKAEPKKVILQERWREDIMKRFTSKE